MEVEERPVKLEELKDFAECGLCGKAAVISPWKGSGSRRDICFTSGMDEMGPVIQKLYDTRLTGIQMGRIEGPEGMGKDYSATCVVEWLWISLIFICSIYE